ncbi:luciferin 4-monooxygenase [Bombyx mori]|uniref:Luciferin 4-monooxygenase n=1 Tax=Bombyx mori TaxID=7091 RepID=A0A8R2M491_BOMMO|nr:luciferin 4-monooxygenase [Bombyx mori]
MGLIPYMHSTDNVSWFVNDLCSRIIAQTGIPTDRYHFGKLLLQSLKDDPDFVLLIDGATGQSETNKSVSERSIQCAVSLTELGLKKGDVIVIMGYNHLDLTIPLYAALYLGIIIFNVSTEMTDNALAQIFASKQPKAIFCQNRNLVNVKNALEFYEYDIKLLTFDDSDHKDVLTFSELMTGFGSDTSIGSFKPTDFDPEETVALITETSGTTGAPKGAALTHKNLVISITSDWRNFESFPTPIKSLLIVTPLNWISTTLYVLSSSILRYKRIQSSKPTTKEHICDLINTYKPSFLSTTPPFMLKLLGNKDRCDFNSFENIRLGGCAITTNILEYITKSLPHAEISLGYGLTEAGGGRVFMNRSHPLGSIGQPTGTFNYRLIDVETQKDILEPNVQGELWLKGPSIFKEYYNDPKSTKEAFSEDGWLKTGDIMYWDEHFYFYFVERLKLLIHYKNHQISPLEIEKVIRQHPGVLDVIVTSITDVQREELPCACVVLKDGRRVTEQEIKDLVRDSLTDPKQLRGGVFFLKEMPMNPQLKIDRRKIKEFVINSLGTKK